LIPHSTSDLADRQSGRIDANIGECDGVENLPLPYGIFCAAGYATAAGEPLDELGGVSPESTDREKSS
jgi:hypothetical protein